ncbi:amino acid oxidase [Acrocarpospora corrugata]|uniref:D-amino-acid oxidase n=1 Tax=Acrocarpospora corrugata TaxID=35763 RepID=A0A5M3W9L9_9ACTN|nr:FAD-dependent oxidoreductase [Acrocarpospora corrugata]GES03873.1 amino acid oxidase [Acrocarpospora corrugata]
MAGGADVVVVGAGVIGLTTAVCLAESGLRVQVWSSLFRERTTSAVAGAMIGGPVFTEPLDSTVRWQRTSMDEFTALAKSPGTGSRVARGRLVSRLGDDIPPWAAALPGYQPCTPTESAGFPVAFWITSPLVDMPVYLDYLTDRLIKAGGDLQVRTVTNLAEPAAAAPAVVNCTGVGAATLAGDDHVRPIRGQHVIVENPGLDDFFYEGGAETDWTGYMPHPGRVVLGGNATPDNWTLSPDPTQTEAILSRCIAIEPRLSTARILAVEVGLRPGRPSIRLEPDPNTNVIHCYGHGGVGVSMSWGCAHEVTTMLTTTGSSHIRLHQGREASQRRQV